MSDRLDELIAKYFEDSLSAPEKLELAEALDSAPSARARFVAHVRWSGALAQACARRNEGAAEAAPAIRFPARTWRPAVLALAASILVAFGIGLYLRTSGVPGAVGPAVATLADVSGAGNDPAVTLTGPDGRPVRAGKGSVIPGGTTVAVAGSARASVLLTDGSTVDLAGNSQMRFAPASDPTALALARGAIYCSVTPRRAGERPFVIGLPGDRTASVLGTRFELTADGAAATLRVETGRVVLRTPLASREAGPLEMLKADAAGAVSLPEPIPLYAIAAWKFRSEQGPAGTVLFQDDFEKGIDRWEPLRPLPGRIEVAEGQGVSGGRCLLMHLKPQDPLAVFPKFEPGCRNFEVRYRSRIAGGKAADPKGLWTRDGLVFRVPTARLGALTAKGTTSMRYHPSGLSAGWVDHRFLVRGTEIYEVGIQEGAFKFDLSSRLHVRQGDYTQVGLSAYAETGDLDFYVDDFMIIKQADPVDGDGSGPGAFPVQPGAVLFQDDFTEGLDRWDALKIYGREKIDPGEMELVDGRGIAGKRSLVLHLKPGDSRGAVAFPNVGVSCRNFEFTCQILVTPDPVVFGLVYRFPGSPVGYDFQTDTGSSKVYGPFVDGWAQFRGEVKDGKTYQAWFQNGRLLKEKTGQIPTGHGPFTGVGLSCRAEGKATDFCVNDVTIRKLGE